MVQAENQKVYFHLYEVLAFVVLVTAGDFLASLGMLADDPVWVVGRVVVPPLVIFAFLIWWTPAFYRTADYRLTDEEIEYRCGVFFQQKTTVPYNQITSVNASQGPLQRLVVVGVCRHLHCRLRRPDGCTTDHQR